MVFPSNLNLQPMGIRLPEPTRNWELKHTLIQILPKFSAISGEDPQRHLQDFEMAISTVRTEGNMGEFIRLTAFPFTLLENARTWCYSLEDGSVTTWAQLQQKFLERYFPAARILAMRKAITSIKMGNGESLYNYWERYKKLIARCPQHKISTHDLVQNFVGGLRAAERSFINACCGGNITNKAPNEAFKWLGDMAEDSRDDGGETFKQTGQETSKVEGKIDDLCSAVKLLVTNLGSQQKKTVKMCGFCQATSHATDECPTLQTEEANAIMQAQGNGQQRKFDPNAQYYKPGWRNHENFRWAQNNGQQGQQGNPQGQQPYPQQLLQNKGPSLTDMVNNLGTSFSQENEENAKFKQETRNGFQNMQNQMGQLLQAITRLEKKQGELPAQVELPPKAQLNAITLRGGKLLPEKVFMPGTEPIAKDETGINAADEKEPEKEEESKAKKGPVEELSPIKLPKLVIQPPFPYRVVKQTREKELNEMMNIFKKVEINLPF